MYWAAVNSTSTHIRRGRVAYCGSKSRYQCMGSYRCNRKISDKCPSCTAERRITSVSCTESTFFQPDDHPRRVAFAQWFVNQTVIDMHFASSVLFCEEAIFSSEGAFNTHNVHK
ncbi:hypothetical protein TNCT_479521 [Trichonephila clavata]|uniref:Uncharacterized protein n=1 Tax=Trichonephila clavata TaxID=2740835 RepID=A0A8X6HCY2_TRICU|nr:hypothetical protein TNCT_479521 [Trichonephila clavata]